MIFEQTVKYSVHNHILSTSGWLYTQIIYIYICVCMHNMCIRISVCVHIYLYIQIVTCVYINMCFTCTYESTSGKHSKLYDMCIHTKHMFVEKGLNVNIPCNST